MINRLFLGLALVVVPLLYVSFCMWMTGRNVSRLCYASYFVLFGTLGGWCLGVGLSPSGLGAICLIFLVTAAPLACVVSSVALQGQRIRTRFEKVAIVGGYSYVGLVVVWIVAILLFS